MDSGRPEINLQSDHVKHFNSFGIVNWKETGIGEPESWPQSLHTAVEIIRNVSFPMAIAWGAEYCILANEAFKQLINRLGFLSETAMPAGLVFLDTWQKIEPEFDQLTSQNLEISSFLLSDNDANSCEFKLSIIRLENRNTGGILIAASEIKNDEVALKELYQSRQALEFVVDAADLATWDYNPVTDEFTANNRFKEWCGLPENHSILPPEALVRISEKDQERVIKAIETALDYSSGGRYDIVYSIMDGINDRERIVKAKGKAYFNDNKKAYRFNGTLEDITVEVLAHRALEESEQRFRTIADTAPSLIWMSGLDGLCYFFNKGWLDFTGRRVEQEIGIGWTEGVHPDDLERCLAIYRTSFAAQKEFYMEYRLRRYDRVYRWISDKGVPHLDIDGLFLGYIGGCMDIDEQKNFAAELEFKVEERTGQLKESNAKLNAKNRDLELRILSEFSESFAAYKSGQEFFNSLIQDLSVKSQMDYVLLGELLPVGEDFYDIKCFAVSEFGKIAENFQYPLFDGPCREVINGNVYSYPKNCRITFPENETMEQFKVEGYIGYPLYNNEGRITGLVAAMHQQEIKEVSYVESLLKIAAKRAELELERMRNEIKLAEQNKELQRQNAELDSFNYIASHDLQEPLRKIQTFISLIQETEHEHISQSGKGYFSRITASARRMQNLIVDLLTYSRANNSEIHFTEVNLNELIEEVKADLSVSAQERNSTITCADLPVLKVLPLQMHQLFLNLIENSIKYSEPDRAPVIKIAATVVNGQKVSGIENINTNINYWKISIEDNGIGFDQQYEHKIFELFQRLHSRNQYEGTGIGLAICKKIVTNHLGFISAKGHPGIGSVFNIFLPFQV
ncbi:PAS domain-containing sensor histidine kinase [Dyadobacter frigoris]|uniref:histidine kinase n=1 Tax=Dyadobacter frigoris TaxID=2576211 RepID=A0A4U6D524_9BACT|nr:PAS domain-containing sensor histidine kinase [Dyadobacter frigoris]TKT92439.1 PAS domain S-box protein [Dyadobacter frigoris]GLU53632.1 hypothetical protein Dfri01_30930 [Dyadobacter frigoris]